jgi:hypothetical protein
VNTKSILTSKTFWFNLLTGAATAASYAVGFLPPQYAVYATIAQSVINIALRIVTSQPVTIPTPLK